MTDGYQLLVDALGLNPNIPAVVPVAAAIIDEAVDNPGFRYRDAMAAATALDLAGMLTHPAIPAQPGPGEDIAAGDFPC